MACGPSRGAAALVWAGLLELESRSDGRKEKPPTGGPRVAERGEGEGVAPIGLWRGKTGRWVGPGEEKNGPARRFWAAGKEGKEGKREVGWAKNDRE